MVPEELRRRSQWLIWKFEEKKGAAKPAKMPYYASGKRRTGVQGSADDMAALVSFDVAVASMSRMGFEGIGFAFLKLGGLIGIDIDNAIDPETGEISPRAREIIKACNSYTELSPSKKGVHIFLLGDTENNKSNDIGLEVFSTSQFFTFTGEHYSGTPSQVNPVDPAVLRRLHATIDEAKGKDKKRPAAAAGAALPVDARAKVEAALAVLSAECGYDDWIQIGMAIHAELGDGGMAVWDYWSSKAAKYPGGKTIEQHWKSFKPGGITGATLFKRAIDAGWKPPRSPKLKPGSAGKARKPSQGEAPAGGDDDGPPDDGPPPEGATRDPSDDLPLIKWRNGQLPLVVSQAEDALIESDAGIFQRASQLVRVVSRDTPSIRNYKRPAGTLGLHHVDMSYLVEEFTRVARWEKYDSRADAWRRINAPKEVAATYLSRVGRWHVPRLWSVISAPTLRPDGTVLQKAGYDADMQSWFGPGNAKFPTIPDQPTHGEAKAALELLRKRFSSLPFETPVDEAVLLSLVLTGLVRRSLPTAPIGGITAPDAGTGKTLLADAVSILATGASAPAIKYPDSDEEAAKLALAVLAEGDAVVLIDNVDRPLYGDWLCSILTSESFRQRVLGRSEMLTVPTTTQWLATGNQLVFEGDLALRALMCRIDAKCERPDARVFTDDLRVLLGKERPELVAAGITVMRAFIATGQRMADHCDPWGRFEHWSEMVRAPLIWLDIPDPCNSRVAIDGNDPKRDELQRMLSAWWASFKSESKTAIDAITHANGPAGLPGAQMLGPVLGDVCQDRDKSFNSKRLGKWLGRHLGRRVGGMHFEKSGKDEHGSWQWKVINVKGDA